jgi:quercetin dioxygenase-like cupin family protein
VTLPEPRVVPPEVVHEGPWARVLRVVLEEVERTPPHVHERPTIEVTVRGCFLRLRGPDGELLGERFTHPGEVVLEPPGGEPHAVENGGPGRYEALWIEPAPAVWEAIPAGGGEERGAGGREEGQAGAA